MHQWAALCFVAALMGMNKTGIPGLGMFCVPLLASVFPARTSTGLMLLLLCFADIFAVAYYRRHAKWGHVLKLLPWALAGMGVGSVVVRFVNDDLMRPIIGFLVLALLIVTFWWNRRNDDTKAVPAHWSFAAVMGFLAGLTTQLANAAGPIMIIYLLSMRLPKREFIGTGAWYFLILNYLKVPLFIMEGRVTLESLRTDLLAFPFVLIGVVAGIIVVKYISQKWFNIVVQVLAALAAIRLVVSMVEMI